jgi:amino acid transporter
MAKPLTDLVAGAQDEPATGFRRALGPFDFTLLVLGAVVGADVYIVASLGASYLGPAQLLAWLGGGVLAGLIVLSFVQCSYMDPEVGGTYAYVRKAFGPLAGFMAGWALYLGEAVVLPIFPTAFANYLTYFLPGLSDSGRLATQVGLIAAVTGVNIVGVRASGRLNDLLTVAKLVPLAILIVAGLVALTARPSVAAGRLLPFVPLGWSGFGPALILIFLAYAGFELGVMPAGEVVRPERTLPRGLITAMAIATFVYVLSAFAVSIGLPWQTAAASTRPVADAFEGLSAEIGWTGVPGGLLMSVGGLISIGAAYDVYTLSVARLSYAMAADKLLPAPLARIHRRFATPYVALLVQAVFGFIMLRALDLAHLIDAGMFLIGLCYAATALAALRLVSRDPAKRLPVPGLRLWLVLGCVSGLYLSAQAPTGLKLLGLAGIAIGVGYYLIRAKTALKCVAGLGHFLTAS